MIRAEEAIRTAREMIGTSYDELDCINLIKKIIGMDIMDTAVYLFLASQGYIKGRTVPIVVDGIQSVEAYINPIPAGLVLTGIVVSVSVSALMLALSIRLYYRYNTLNLDEIIALSGKEEV